jgi:hypothetical protein
MRLRELLFRPKRASWLSRWRMGRLILFRPDASKLQYDLHMILGDRSI